MTMKTCKVSDLFTVTYGVNLELNALQKSKDGINFVSRTSKNNGVSAKVLPVPDVEPIPAGTITVAGGGSVMEAFLQLSPYYSGRDLFYLTVKEPMSNAQKLYYCQCLKSNKFRFSYGRQANVTLPELLIPTLESIPQFVTSFSIKEYGVSLLQTCSFDSSISLYPPSEKTVPLSKLFDVENGVASSSLLRSKKRESENWVPFIRPSYRQETSFNTYVNRQLVPSEKIFPSGSLYVSTNGQGSHTYSYVSSFEFVPNSDVSVLIPKRPMSLQEKLFYAMCITRNRYKFSYGRKPKGNRLGSIQLPLYPIATAMEYDIGKVINLFGGALELL